jgi:hypothetical protein
MYTFILITEIILFSGFYQGSSSILISFMNTSHVFSFSKDCSIFNLKLKFFALMSSKKKKKQLYDLLKPTFTNVYKMRTIFKHLQNEI